MRRPVPFRLFPREARGVCGGAAVFLGRISCFLRRFRRLWRVYAKGVMSSPVTACANRLASRLVPMRNSPRSM